MSSLENWANIDRNSTLCYNHLAIAGSPYTAHTTVELTEDFSYNPGQTWREKIWSQVASWWASIHPNIKAGIGVALIMVSVVLALIPGGQSGAAFIQSALVQLAIDVGVTTIGWAISSAMSGEWNASVLGDSLAETLFL